MRREPDPHGGLPTRYRTDRAGPDDLPELGWLQRAEALGVPISPMAVVPAQVERDFYRWNHLAARMEGLFAAIDARDPDEDDLETLAPEAAAWVREHALLDEVVDAFYAAIAELPRRIQVRRPGGAGLAVTRGRPALLAVKRIWAEQWLSDRLASRARGGQGWMPRAHPLLVHDAELHLDDAIGSAASVAIGRTVVAWCDPAGRLGRLALDDDVAADTT